MPENMEPAEQREWEASTLENAANQIKSDDYEAAWSNLKTFLTDWENTHRSYTFEHLYKTAERNVDRFKTTKEAWSVYRATQGSDIPNTVPKHILEFIKWLFMEKGSRNAGN